MSFSELAFAPQADARSAALLLHAMAPVDRQWLLERMPQAAAQALLALLAELDALGIPADASLLDSVLQAPLADAAPAPGPAADAAFLMALDAGGIEALVRSWHSQPPRLVARALCLRSWPWRLQALEQMPPPLRGRVMDLMESMSIEVPSDNAMAMALMAAMRRSSASGRAADGGTRAARPARRGLGLLRWRGRWG